jgi:hypothetical protein
MAVKRLSAAEERMWALAKTDTTGELPFIFRRYKKAAEGTDAPSAAFPKRMR